MFRSVVLLSIVLCVLLCTGLVYSQTADSGSAGLTGSGSVPAIPAVPAAVLASSGSAPVTQAQIGQLNQSLKDLAEEVKKLREQVNAGSGTTALAGSPKGVAGWQEDRIHDLEERVNDQAVFNRQVARYINGEGGPVAGSGKPAVALPTSGTLRIRNDMATPQDVVINGRPLVRVDTRSIMNVPVPVGSITTQIRGESALTWSIGAPNYTQEIIIAPASRNPLDTTPPRWLYDPLTGSYVVAR